MPHTESQPLQRLAYAFLSPEDAWTHLHALWRRGLECWTVTDGSEQRLDTDYRPLLRRAAETV